MLSLFLNKYVLMGLAILGLLFGAYEAGKGSGYQDGYQVGWNAQQAAINKLIDAQNAAAKEQTDKITALEITASAADVAASEAKAQAVSARKKIVASYRQANPQVSASCGWSIP